MKNIFKPLDILYGKLRPNLNKVWLADRSGICSTDIFVIEAIEGKADPVFASYIFRSPQFNKAVISQLKGAQLPRIGWSSFEEIQIPLPPIAIQKEIVTEIEGYQKVINGARAVIDNYRPHIAIDPDWEMMEIGEICKPEYGFTEKAMDQGDVRFIRITDISETGFLKKEDLKYIMLTQEARNSLLSKGDILVARTGATFGKTMLFEEEYDAVFASYLIRLRFPKDKINPRYYWAFAQSDNYWKQANALMTGGGQPQFNGNAIVQVKIPVPPLETQEAIVAEIQAEQALVNANRELIERFEKKIQTVLNRIWSN
jgi:restriction endonuclease S subunit